MYRNGSDLHKERLVTWWCVVGERGDGGGVWALSSYLQTPKRALQCQIYYNLYTKTCKKGLFLNDLF